MRNVNENIDAVGAAIALFPSGCCILTVEHGGRSTGFLASWVQQASFEPLMLSVCVKRGRPAQPLIDGAGRFVLNIIPEDPTAMFKHFGKGFAPLEDAFTGLAIEPSDYGPMLTDCIAQLGCKVVYKVGAGDHDLYLVEVAAARFAEGAKPYVHLRKSALSY